jgi:Tol biopolymer transport system component
MTTLLPARAIAIACLVCVLATGVHAQSGVPFATYRTFETTHFILTFEPELEAYARRAATQAEAAYARLQRAYGKTPRGKIRLVLIDQGDIFNGSATPLPTNRIVAFANTPVEDDRFYTRDPVELLATHELAHIFHLDEARGGWRVLRWIFGRSEPTFPHLFDGDAVIEGLATFYESSLTDGGRVRGSQFPETLRAAVLETNGPHVDESEFDRGAWPIDRHYVYGSLFFNHLATRYGDTTPPSWMAQRAGSFKSIVSRGARVGSLFGGNSLTQEWNQWIARERDQAMQLQDQLRASAPGLAETTRVCDMAHVIEFPRASPDGSRVAFIATDQGRKPLGLYVADLPGCGARRVARVNSSHALAWTPDARSIVFSQLQLVDNARLFGDLYRIDVSSGAVKRLTKSARLASPDVHPNGRTIVAVQYLRERSRLVTIDIESGTLSPLTEFGESTQWGPARWSPDGSRLAAIRFRRGVSLDLVLLSADGSILQTLTDDRALEGIPEWDASAPAGMQRLFFTSDRSGVRELYSLELEGDASPRVYLTAHVATGIHDATVVPTPNRSGSAGSSNRTTLVATITHADGLHLERFETDRARWVPSSASGGALASPAAGIEPLSSPLDNEVPTKPYSPARDLIPHGWSPVVATVEELGLFVGGAAAGVDVIGRHSWQAVGAYGPDGRTIGSASYAYRRFAHAAMFGQLASTWRLEQRIESSVGELLRLERKRSAALGIVFPWQAYRHATIVSTSFQVEDRHRENAGDLAAVSGSAPIEQDPTLVGGRLAMQFGNTQAGLRSISVQDGLQATAAIDYLEATEGDRWRSGWDVGTSLYKSFPSWTTYGRPVLAVNARIAEQRGPAAGRLTAGGLGTTSIVEASSSDFEVRGYPPGFVAANAMWSVRTEMRLPLARISRGLGALPFYLNGFSSSWFVDSVGAAGSVDRLGRPQLVSTGAELSTDITLFSFLPVRVRTGVGVALEPLGSVSRGDARFYVTAGTGF